jgi:hypothetical protein
MPDDDGKKQNGKLIPMRREQAHDPIEAFAHDLSVAIDDAKRYVSVLELVRDSIVEGEVPSTDMVGDLAAVREDVVAALTSVSLLELALLARPVDLDGLV